MPRSSYFLCTQRTAPFPGLHGRFAWSNVVRRIKSKAFPDRQIRLRSGLQRFGSHAIRVTKGEQMKILAIILFMANIATASELSSQSNAARQELSTIHIAGKPVTQGEHESLQNFHERCNLIAWYIANPSKRSNAVLQDLGYR